MPHCDYCQQEVERASLGVIFKNSGGDSITVNWCDACDDKITHAKSTMTPCAKCGDYGQEINGVSLCATHASAYMRQLTATLPKPAKPAKPAHKPVQAPRHTVKPAASPAVVKAPAPAAAPQHAAPAPATSQPQATATLPTNTVDWARDARRRGWAVLHGMPEQQLRAYQTRVEYLVSYPAAIAELARIESSRYWLTVNVRKAM